MEKDIKTETINRIRQHLIYIRKHKKAYELKSQQTHWFRPEKVPAQYMPVIEEMKQLDDWAYYMEELLFELIYNYKNVDFKKLEKMDPLRLNPKV